MNRKNENAMRQQAAGSAKTLPGEIERLEAEIAAMQERVAAPDFYTRDTEQVQQKLRELSAAEDELERRIERWGELETLKESFLD